MSIMYDENEDKFDAAEEEELAKHGFIEDGFAPEDFDLECTTLQDFPAGTWE